MRNFGRKKRKNKKKYLNQLFYSLLSLIVCFITY